MISIITVVRNGVKTIEKTILSVLIQDFKEIQFIVVDGVSTDGTLEILEKYKDEIAITISEPDNGVYDAMNKGISVSKGDWLYFLGCDDVLFEKSTISNIFNRPDIINFNVIYGNVLFSPSNIVFDGAFDYDKHALKSICHQSIFYRKSVFDKFGYFSTKYKTASDYVFNMQLFCYDISKWLYIDTIIAIYNETGLSASSNDSAYHNTCLALKYDNFSPYVSKFVLSRIFYSSFLKFFMNNNVLISSKYLYKVIRDVGLYNHLRNLKIILASKRIN
jgi:glycosyltransferase involved in cell wall biosynthesis